MITGKAKTAGVIGWPARHSKSPLLHNYWLARYGLDGAYIPLPLAPEHLEEGLRALAYLGFSGANVTLPHKEQVFDLCDELSGAARAIGAVNWLSFAEGKILGDNSDTVGFLANLQATVPDWQAEAGPALVVGAGGAARAICYALLSAGVPEIRLVNRTESRAEALAEDLTQELSGTIEVFSWNRIPELLCDITLLVNSSSLGMEGKPPLLLGTEASSELTALARDAVVADIVYTPLETGLLRAAAARGNPTVDGLGMLIHQARPCFEAWFGKKPEVTEELRALLLAAGGG